MTQYLKTGSFIARALVTPQVSEYGAAVLLLLMATFLLISHWLACVFYAIAYWERPLLHAPVGWLDHLANLTGELF